MPRQPGGPPRKVQKQKFESTSAASSGSGGFVGKGKGQGGKGKGGSRTQTKLVKAAINLDNRLRTVEGILGDSVEVPDTLPEAQAAVAAGPAYFDAVAAKGRGHGLGPPHLRAWSEFIRHLKDVAGIPIDLIHDLAEHVGQYPDPVALDQVVKHFTAKNHHDKSTIVIVVSVSEKIASLWFSIKRFLMTRGGQQHIGQPPRGPIFRDLISEL